MAITDKIAGTLTNNARLSRECLIYLNWRASGALPAPSIYELPSKLALTLFALQEAVEPMLRGEDVDGEEA